MSNETVSLSALRLFCKEPYRLFFPLGLIWAFVGSSHWLALQFKLTTDYGPFYHGMMQIIGFGGCFASGFLLTALPNFLGTKASDPWELFLSLALGAAGGALLMAGLYKPAGLAFAALMIHIDIFTIRRFLKRQGEPPPFMYLAWGLAMGTLGAILTLYPLPGMAKVGIKMLEQGMLIAFVMGIGSFLGARMLGTFQPPAFLFKMTPGKPPVPPFVKMKRYFALGGLLLFASFWLENFSPIAGKLLRAAVVTAQLCLFGRIYRLPQSPAFSARALWLSLWLLITGLWAAAFFANPMHEIAALHVAYIGGLGLMMLAMSLRVVGSHGGVIALWEKSRVSIVLIVACALVALLSRVTAVFVPKLYFQHLAGAAAIWNIALIIWAFIALPKLTPSHREQP